MNQVADTVFRGSLYAISASFLFLALLVLFLGKKDTATQFWILECGLLSIGALFIALASRGDQSPATAMIFGRLGMSSGAASMFVFLAFSLAFLDRLHSLRWLFYLAGAATLFVVILFSTTNLLLKTMEFYGHGIYRPVVGPLMPLYLLVVIFNTFTPIVLFIREYRRSIGHVKLQLGYILLAMVNLAIAANFSIFTTTQQKHYLLASLPFAFFVLTPVLITYAIVRHQLWDIRTVIHKTILWIFASCLVAIPVSVLLKHGTSYAQKDTFVAVTGALLLLGIFFVHFRIFQPWLDHRFARRKYDIARVVNAFNQEVANLKSVQELVSLLTETIKNTLYTQTMWIHITESDNEKAKVISDSGSGRPLWEINSPECKWLQDHNQEVDLTHLDQYEFDSGIKKQFQDLRNKEKIAILLPLVREARLYGVIILGEKKNFRAYTREDFEFLARIQPTAAVALANAALYDQLNRLTEDLENRVIQRTAQLQDANEQLQDLDRLKTKFFANITHEFRTPLTLILAPLEDLLAQHKGKEPLAQDLRAMYQNANRLLRQINGLLELAKIDAGELSISMNVFSLNALLAALVQNFQVRARQKELTLTFSPLEENDTLLGDIGKLEMVFNNLLGNAVKFTDKGGCINVAIEDSKNWLTVKVSDTGIGIPKDHLNRIFDRFAQVESGTARRYEGTGIGLSLVKEIVHLHKGTIEVSSQVGKGSVFKVNLQKGDIPVLNGQENKSKDSKQSAMDIFDIEEKFTSCVESTDLEIPTESTTGAFLKRIVVVEDNTDLRAYLGRRLREIFEVVLCPNGKKALETISTWVPDLVVSDVMMPEMSGYDLCDVLKKNPKTSAIPVILLTAYKEMDRTLEGFEVGADDYLTKPFNFEELLARIRVQLKLVELSRRLAEKEKGDVLNLVAVGLAHEVRNPINAIFNAVGPLKESLACSPSSGTTEAIQELFSVISESAERIDQLVADFLGVSRPDQNEVSDWQVSTAVDSVLRLLKCKHGEQISVKCIYKHNIPVFGRTSRLNQILVNLLDNAMCAVQPDGCIWVSTEQKDNIFRLVVRDNGPGIPDGLEQRIFDPLFSADKSRVSTGLGLYITRRIVEEHNGRIFAHTVSKGGAEFVVEIPLNDQKGKTTL